MRTEQSLAAWAALLLAIIAAVFGDKSDAAIFIAAAVIIAAMPGRTPDTGDGHE